jgi:hypothetical protein
MELRTVDIQADNKLVHSMLHLNTIDSLLRKNQRTHMNRLCEGHPLSKVDHLRNQLTAVMKVMARLRVTRSLTNLSVNNTYHHLNRQLELLLSRWAIGDHLSNPSINHHDSISLRSSNSNNRAIKATSSTNNNSRHLTSIRNTSRPSKVLNSLRSHQERILMHCQICQDAGNRHLVAHQLVSLTNRQEDTVRADLFMADREASRDIKKHHF